MVRLEETEPVLIVEGLSTPMKEFKSIVLFIMMILLNAMVTTVVPVVVLWHGIEIWKRNVLLKELQ